MSGSQSKPRQLFRRAVTCEVVVSRLTPQLAKMLEKEAAEALNGDGSCSIDNMEKSCFASETCSDSRFPDLSLEVMLAAQYAFVAMKGSMFLGCVTANTPRAHMKQFLPQNVLLLSNLCVAYKARGQKVGKRLVDTIKQVAKETAKTLCLTVARSENAVLRSVFQARESRLHNTYTHCGFRLCNTYPLFYVYTL